MGEPVKIIDLAKQLIRFYGYEPGVNMEIKVVGLRPGEKLYEEMLMEEEGLQDTANRMIHIGKPIDMDDTLFKEQLSRLAVACQEETDNMKDIVAQIVPTYQRKSAAEAVCTKS